MFQTSGAALNSKDYYKTLNVAKDATAKDIKKAYYQLAKKYHPDTNKGDSNAQKKFQDVSEAYEVLSDDSKRKQYDAFGTGDGGANPFAGAGGFQQPGGNWNFSSNIDPEELFRNIFGDQWRTASGGRGGGFSDAFSETNFDFGAPQEYHMNLSFVESARGCNKELSVTVTDECVKCRGTGADSGTDPERCPQCHGTGMETVTTGPFMMRSTCRRCHGKGTWIKIPCGSCRGSGQVRTRQKVMVPVPAGIEDGQTVRMPVGKKEIFITFRVAKSEFFRRQGSDVHTDARISVAQAMLGGVIRVQGIRDDINVQVPSGTGSHSRILLKGKGIPKPSGYGTGDHYIHVKVDVPKKLTEKQRALLQAYAELEPETPGTVNGFTYDKKGRKVLMEDPEGTVADIREALEEDDGGENGKDKAT